MVFLIIGAAGLIHRLNAQHAERIVPHRYSRFAPGAQGAPSRTRSGLFIPWTLRNGNTPVPVNNLGRPSVECGRGQ
ncbi:hypothetical protein ACFWBX_03570 [Streptomyces sp. NPDC059991]|uniref:hypothetical protein n=1 Tax=Streptomyces sp. NPDC059991 TaxID=3347028 RepID=UPI0036BF0A6E